MRLTPFSIASWLERWIVTPSAIGSENGTPISTASAALATDASSFRNSRGSGKPGRDVGDSAGGSPWPHAARERAGEAGHAAACVAARH